MEKSLTSVGTFQEKLFLVQTQWGVTSMKNDRAGISLQVRELISPH